MKIDKDKYDNSIPWEGGILLQSIEKPDVFVKVYFGNGTNNDQLEDDCDDYIMIDILKIDNHGDFSVIDGGMLEFNQEKSGYEGSIINTLPDAFDFMELDINGYRPIVKLI